MQALDAHVRHVQNQRDLDLPGARTGSLNHEGLTDQFADQQVPHAPTLDLKKVTK